MVHRGNPFHEQISGDYFVGREPELDTFARSLEGLAEGASGHVFVAGIHGTGKSSFLNKAVEMAKAAHFVGAATSIDDQASAGTSVAKIIRATLMAVQEFEDSRSTELSNDWDRGENSTEFRQARRPDPDSDAIRDDLGKLIAIARVAGAKGVVVCVDEGQSMAPSGLSALKNALQSMSGIMVVLSLRLQTAEGGARKAGRTLLDKIGEDAQNDTGASRIFVTELEMGPFATETEARRCITRRLEDNIVSFDFEVINGIVELSERVPRDIIAYASKVWDLAAARIPAKADEALLTEVVRDQHQAETDRAYLLVSQLSMLKRKTLRALLKCGGDATVGEIAKWVHDELSGDIEVVARAVHEELEDLTADIGGLEHTEDRFKIVYPVDMFALRLALQDK